MEKLTRTESRLESVQLHKDEMRLETEAKIAARGAGRFFLFFGQVLGKEWCKFH